MKIALDIESTLASVTPEFITELNHRDDLDLDPLRECGSWMWMEEDNICSVQRFLDVTEELWQDQWQTIPTREAGLDAITAQMAAQHDLDIVTSRTGCDGALKAWLDAHGICYDDFYGGVDNKALMDYDVFIDDKPHLAEDLAGSDAHIYLINHPYNGRVDEGAPHITRVDTVATAWATMMLPRQLVEDSVNATPPA